MSVVDVAFGSQVGVTESQSPSGGGGGDGASERTRHMIALGCGVVGALGTVALLICLFRILKKRRKHEASSTASSTTMSPTSPIYSIPVEGPLRTTEDVAKRYQRSVSALSTKSQLYLVPFDVLPNDFDYSSKEVEVKADYVILKDLRLLERYNSSNYEGIVNEAYERQESYNPYVYGTIPPLQRDPYKKQEAYNPTFFY